jgi:hypothetical protein
MFAVMALIFGVIPAAMAGPGSNKNKDVFPIVFDGPGAIDCGGGSFLDISVDGWVQVMTFNETNNHIERAIFHIEVVFTNADGDTFRWMDVGPDMFYTDKDGNLVHTITGRPADLGGVSLNGHLVLVNDELVSISGNIGPTDVDQACAAIG